MRKYYIAFTIASLGAFAFANSKGLGLGQALFNGQTGHALGAAKVAGAGARFHHK
jgi:hypothetical protein